MIYPVEVRPRGAPVAGVLERLVPVETLEAFAHVPTRGNVQAGRAAEARLLARRIDELTREGPYDFGDVALLLRATTHLAFYERALEERGIPTYVLGGRGYRSQQQVADLRAWLAALANPRDELALYSVLASPLAGVSLDGLALLGLRSRTTPHHLWRMLEEDGVAAELPDGDRELAERFVELFRDERETAPRVSLESLIDRAVTRTGYDRAVLAMPAGDRRLANVRKLMRMAREYESEEGRDLRGFIDFVAERDLIQEREGQAPLEAEELDAVRLMTIHRAKGLEFPVVCVADLGKGGREDDDALRISDDGEVGPRLAEIGGGSIDSEKLKGIKERRKLEAEEEEKRIFYVAVTRAQEHLVRAGPPTSTSSTRRSRSRSRCAGPGARSRPICPSWEPAERPSISTTAATCV